jgi:hypothetical protein
VRCFVGGEGGRMFFEEWVACLYGFGMAWGKVGFDTWRLEGLLGLAYGDS